MIASCAFSSACILGIDDGLIGRNAGGDGASTDAAVDGGASSDGGRTPPPVIAARFVGSQASLGQMAVSNGVISWVAGNRLRTCPTTGCTGGPTMILDPGTAELTGALWGAADKVYDVEHSGSAWALRGCPFAVCNKDATYFGDQLRPVLGGSPFVTDGTESVVIVESGEIRVCPNANCVWTTLVGPVKNVFSFALTATRLFWTESGANGRVLWCLRSGCVSPTTFKDALPNPRGLVADSANVYWTNLDDGTVLSCPISGCTAAPRVLATGQSAPLRIALDGDHLYWVNSGDDTIGTALISDNDRPLVFGRGVPKPEGIAVDAKHVFVSSPSDSSIYVMPR